MICFFYSWKLATLIIVERYLVRVKRTHYHFKTMHNGNSSMQDENDDKASLKICVLTTFLSKKFFFFENKDNNKQSIFNLHACSQLLSVLKKELSKHYRTVSMVEIRFRVVMNRTPFYGTHSMEISRFIYHTDFTWNQFCGL